MHSVQNIFSVHFQIRFSARLFEDQFKVLGIVLYVDHGPVLFTGITFLEKYFSENILTFDMKIYFTRISHFYKHIFIKLTFFLILTTFYNTVAENICNIVKKKEHEQQLCFEIMEIIFSFI